MCHSDWREASCPTLKIFLVRLHVCASSLLLIFCVIDFSSSARLCLFFVTHSCNQGLMGRGDQSGPACFFRRYRSFSDGHFSDNRCMTQEHLQPTQAKISSSQSENSSPTAVELPLVLFLKYCSSKVPLLCLLLFSATSFKSSSVPNVPFVHIL